VERAIREVNLASTPFDDRSGASPRYAMPLLSKANAQESSN
jgi:hypothetical protein